MDTKTAQEIVDSNPHIREFIRRRAGVFGPGFQPPIKVVVGKAAPEYNGEPHHYTNKSGELIHHPSAYSKKGWSSLQYHGSTLRVDVGAEWLAKHRPVSFAATAA